MGLTQPGLAPEDFACLDSRYIGWARWQDSDGNILKGD
jgi:hypothetical protein